jgi:hypothetical protein
VTYALLRNMYPDARSAPLLTAITRPIEDPEPRDLSHTRWPRAIEVLGGCRHSLLLTEFLGRDVDTGNRLGVYGAALGAVIEATRPAAVWWPGSQQALPPGEPVGDPVGALVNVRTFHDPTDPDVAIMDTLGMAQLGLPDLQCHFRYLGTDLMAGLLRNAARYQYEGGRITDAIRGFTVHQRWAVRSGSALAEPVRQVLTIDPGVPFGMPIAEPGVRHSGSGTGD